MLWLIWLGLREFLRGAMQQANMRVGFLNRLTVDFEDEAQHAMRSRMLRAEVHRITLNLSHRSRP